MDKSTVEKPLLDSIGVLGCDRHLDTLSLIASKEFAEDLIEQAKRDISRELMGKISTKCHDCKKQEGKFEEINDLPSPDNKPTTVIRGRMKCTSPVCIADDVMDFADPIALHEREFGESESKFRRKFNEASEDLTLAALSGMPVYSDRWQDTIIKEKKVKEKELPSHYGTW